MRNFIFILAALVASLVSTAQNTVIHDPNAQVRTVDNFHALKVATGIHLYFTQGSERAVAVSAATPEYRDRIRTEVKNGVLHIYYENHWNWSFRDMIGKGLKVYVSSSLLDGLDASSGAEVEVEGTLKSANLALRDFSEGAPFFREDCGGEPAGRSVQRCAFHDLGNGYADEGGGQQRERPAWVRSCGWAVFCKRQQRRPCRAHGGEGNDGLCQQRRACQLSGRGPAQGCAYRKRRECVEEMSVRRVRQIGRRRREDEL